jgi:hypothetical protein
VWRQQLAGGLGGKWWAQGLGRRLGLLPCAASYWHWVAWWGVVVVRGGWASAPSVHMAKEGGVVQMGLVWPCAVVVLGAGGGGMLRGRMLLVLPLPSAGYQYVWRWWHVV